MPKQHQVKAGEWKLVKEAPVYVHRPRFLTREEHQRFVAEGDKKRVDLERQYRDLRSTKPAPPPQQTANPFAQQPSTNMCTTPASDPNGWWKKYAEGEK